MSPQSLLTTRYKQFAYFLFNVSIKIAVFQNRHYSWWHPVRGALNWGIPSTLGYKPWVTKTVNELLWGYDEPLFTAAQTFMPNPPPFDR